MKKQRAPYILINLILLCIEPLIHYALQTILIQEQIQSEAVKIFIKVNTIPM